MSLTSKIDALYIDLDALLHDLLVKDMVRFRMFFGSDCQLIMADLAKCREPGVFSTPIDFSTQVISTCLSGFDLKKQRFFFFQKKCSIKSLKINAQH